MGMVSLQSRRDRSCSGGLRGQRPRRHGADRSSIAEDEARIEVKPPTFSIRSDASVEAGRTSNIWLKVPGLLNGQMYGVPSLDYGLAPWTDDGDGPLIGTGISSIAGDSVRLSFTVPAVDTDTAVYMQVRLMLGTAWTTDALDLLYLPSIENGGLHRIPVTVPSGGLNVVF